MPDDVTIETGDNDDSVPAVDRAVEDAREESSDAEESAEQATSAESGAEMANNAATESSVEAEQSAEQAEESAEQAQSAVEFTSYMYDNIMSAFQQLPDEIAAAVQAQQETSVPDVDNDDSGVVSEPEYDESPANSHRWFRKLW